MHNVDIWNVIEAFRENGLNTLEPSSTLGVSRLETLLSSLFHALNKRVPVSQQSKVDATTALLMNWLLAAYTSGYAYEDECYFLINSYQFLRRLLVINCGHIKQSEKLYDFFM